MPHVTPPPPPDPSMELPIYWLKINIQEINIQIDVDEYLKGKMCINEYISLFIYSLSFLFIN